MRNFLFLIFSAWVNMGFSQEANTKATHLPIADLQKVLNQQVDNKKVFGTSFCIKYKGETWSGTAGDLQQESPYFIASTTKLFVTAIILHLRSQGLLKLDDKISQYLDKSIMQGLHTYKGVDYAQEITIQQLLAHTSGLPDYFQDKNAQGNSLETELMKGNDQFWSFEQCIEMSKKMQPLFKPNEKNKAHYADTNFQLLGKIIENITKKSLSENIETLIIKPLGLKKTYLYLDAADKTPKHLYYKNVALNIPKAMTSFGADGGVVSTSEEMLVFIAAFFEGKLFPKAYIEELKVWNKIFSPLQSGIGIHLFKLLGIELIGHSGLSGALAYYYPKKDLFIAGTVNQVAYPQTSFQVMMKLIQTCLRK